MLVSSIFLASLRLAFRAHYFRFVFFSVFFMLVSIFLSSVFSGRQPATVGLDVGISVVRIMVPLVAILLTQELLFREFERRYFMGSLSYPYARSTFLLGRFLAIVVLAFLMLTLMSFALKGGAQFVGRSYEQGARTDLDFPYFIVMVFVALDVLVLVALACLLSVTASTSGFVLVGSLGFMLVARSYSAIVALLARDSGVVNNSEAYGVGLGWLGYLLPDLGSLDVRMIALYGRMELLPSDWPWLVASNFFYVVFLLSLAVWAINRKRIA